MSLLQNELTQDPMVCNAIAEALTPVELGAELRDRMRARIMQRVSSDPPARTTTLRSTQGDWRTVVDGVAIKILREDRDAQNMTYLVRMAPGAVAPSHDHLQDEECLVLEGEVWMGDHVIRTGDWHIAKAGSEHADFRTKNGCLLLIRAELRAF